MLCSQVNVSDKKAGDTTCESEWKGKKGGGGRKEKKRNYKERRGSTWLRTKSHQRETYRPLEHQHAMLMDIANVTTSRIWGPPLIFVTKQTHDHMRFAFSFFSFFFCWHPCGPGEKYQMGHQPWPGRPLTLIDQGCPLLAAHKYQSQRGIPSGMLAGWPYSDLAVLRGADQPSPACVGASKYQQNFVS